MISKKIKLLIFSFSIFSASVAMAIKPDFYVCRDFVKRDKLGECADDGGASYRAYCGFIEEDFIKGSGFLLRIANTDSDSDLYLEINPISSADLAIDLDKRLSEAGAKRTGALPIYCVLSPTETYVMKNRMGSIQAVDLEKASFWKQ